MFETSQARRQSGTARALIGKGWSWAAARYLLAAVALMSSLNACSMFGSETAAPGAESIPSDYLGSAAADDPQAVQAARDMLNRGGSAVDAVAAAAQVLTVTLPARAGLAGGGLCLVHGADGAVEEIDFLPQSTPGAALPVPGMVRGLATLQARYGKLPWSATSARAEELANTGMAVSAMLIADLQTAGLSTEINGVPLVPGNMLPQHGVADVFAALRTGGPQGFYTGKLGTALVGAGVDGHALVAYQPSWHAVDGLPAGENTIRFSSNDGGKASAAAWLALQNVAAGSAAASRIARNAAGVATGTTTGVASAAATDASGLGVACSFTMGKLWGSGHLLGRLAIYGSAPLEPAASRAMSAAIAGKADSSGLAGVFASGGGTAAAGDLASVAWGSLIAGRAPAQAAAVPRGGEGQGSLAVAERVNAVVCPGLLPDNPQSCVAATDPRSGGYGVNAVRLTPTR